MRRQLTLSPRSVVINVGALLMTIRITFNATQRSRYRYIAAVCAINREIFFNLLKRFGKCDCVQKIESLKMYLPHLYRPLRFMHAYDTKAHEQ